MAQVDSIYREFPVQASSCHNFDTVQYYAFAALAVNEFTDEYYDCPTGNAATDPNCLQYRGNFILQNLSFHRNWYAVPVV